MKVRGQIASKFAHSHRRLITETRVIHNSFELRVLKSVEKLLVPSEPTSVIK